MTHAHTDTNTHKSRHMHTHTHTNATCRLVPAYCEIISGLVDFSLGGQDVCVRLTSRIDTFYLITTSSLAGVKVSVHILHSAKTICMCRSKETQQATCSKGVVSEEVLCVLPWLEAAVSLSSLCCVAMLPALLSLLRWREPWGLWWRWLCMGIRTPTKRALWPEKEARSSFFFITE